ncbi:MAG: hypothetical protein ABJQ70_06900 [Roseobacter sp.]
MSKKNTSKTNGLRRTAAPLLGTVIVSTSAAFGGYSALTTLTSDTACGAFVQICSGITTARLDPPNDVVYTTRAPVASNSNINDNNAIREGAKAPRGTQSGTSSKLQKTN